jgi:hypothetical protein
VLKKQPLQKRFIPFENSVRRRSIVFYKYGSFFPLWFQRNIDDVIPVIYDPNGNLVPDKRGKPADPFPTARWLCEPFVKAGIVPYRKRVPTILRDRFLVLDPHDEWR